MESLRKEDELHGQVERSQRTARSHEDADTAGLRAPQDEDGRTAPGLHEPPEDRRFRAYAESSPDFIVQTDVHGTIQYLNRTDGLRQTADYIGTSIFDWVAEDHHKALELAIRQTVERGENGQIEYRFLSPSGEKAWHSAHLGPLAADGRPNSVLLVIRDITRMKEAENRLRGQEERLRLLQKVTFEGIVIHAEGVILDANQTLGEILGYDVEELIGRNALEFATPETRPVVRAHIESASQQPYECQVVRSDGSIIDVELQGRNLDMEGGTIRAAALRDVTLRKQTDRQISFHAQLLQNVSDAVIATDLDYKITSWNRAAEEYYGWSEAEAAGRSIFELLQPRYPDFEGDEITSTVLAEGAWEGETIHRTKAGALMHLQTKASSIVDEGGAPIGVVSVNRDIGEIRRAQAELRQERDRAQTYLDIAAVMFVALDLQGRLTLINRRGCEILGWEEEEIIGRNWFDHFLPDDQLAEVRAHFKGILNGAAPGLDSFENHVLTKDGERRLIQWHNSYLRDASGKLIGTLSSGQDVTEKRRAERELRASEKNYRELVLSANDVIYTHDLDGNFLSANPAATRLFGYELPQILQLNIGDLVDPEFLPIAEASIEQKVQGRPSAGPYELLVYSKAGDPIWVEVNTRVLRDDENASVLGIARDITDRKRAEEALRRSELALNRAQEVAHLGSWEWHIQENRVEWSDEMYRIFGIEKDGFNGSLTEVIESAIHPDDRAAVERSNLSVIKDKEPIPLEYRIVRPDGEIRTVWAEAGDLSLDDEGTPLILAGITLDITERTLAEEAIKESERILSTLMSNLPGLAYRCKADRHWTLEFVSDGCQALTGYTPHEIISNARVSYAEIIHPQDQQLVERKVRDALSEDRPFRLEYRIITADGEVKWVWEQGQGISRPGDQGVHLEGFITDITERKQAEAELEGELAVTEALARIYAPILSPHSSIEEIAENLLKEASRLTGSEHGYVSEIDAHSGDDIAHALTPTLAGHFVPDKSGVRIVLRRGADGTYPGLWGHALNTKEPFLTNRPDDHPGETTLPERLISTTELLFVPVLSGEELLGQIALAGSRRGFSSQDLAAVKRLANLYALAIQRKRIEAEVRHQRDRAQQYLDVAGVMMVMLDRDQKIQLINHKACEILGYEEPQLLGQDWFETCAPGDFRAQSRRKYLEALRVGEEDQSGIIEPVLTHEGEVRMIAWHDTVLRDGQGNVIGSLSSGTDVTEEKRAEDEIKQHHRELATLLDVSQRMASRFHLEDLLDVVVSSIVESLPDAEAASMWLYDETRGEMVVRAWAGHADDSIAGLSLPTDTSLVGHVYRTQQPYIVADACEESHFMPVGISELDSVRSILGVPMMLEDEPIGVLFADSFSHRHAFDHDDLRLLQSLAGQAAVAVKNARLYEAAQRELRERKRAEAALEQHSLELERAHRLITSLSRVSVEFQAILDADRIMHILGAELRHLDLTCLLAKYDPEGDEVEITFESFPDHLIGKADMLTGESTQRLRFAIDRIPVLAQVIRNEESVLMEGLSEIARELFPKVPYPILKQALRLIGLSETTACLGLPLTAFGRVYGILGVWGPDLTARDLGIFSVFASQVAIALENARLFEQVKIGRTRLQQVMQRLVDVQETERRSIARELHDEIGQILTGLKLTLAIAAELPPVELGPQLAEADAQISQLLDQVRDLSLNLRPSMLDDLGLHPTLIWHFGRVEQQTGIHVEAAIGDLEGRRFDTRLETACFRITQEALTNIARHAHVAHATVTIREKRGILEIVIQDDGDGFNPDAIAGSGQGSGITGMRERAVALGGMLDVDASPGHGTRVTASLPLSGRLDRRENRRRR